MKKTEIDITTERILAHDFVVLSFTAETAAKECFCQALILRMGEAAWMLFVDFFAARAGISLVRDKDDKDRWQIRLRAMNEGGRPQSTYCESSWLNCGPDKPPEYARLLSLAGRIRNSVMDQKPLLIT